MASSQTLVVWSDDYALGLPEIDDQHRFLFELVNAVWVSIINRDGSAESLRLIEQLEHYTLSHFAAEEEFMRETGYSRFASHKGAHEMFIARIAEEKSNALATKYLSLELVHFLRDWLVQHILVSDKAYAEELRQRREEQSRPKPETLLGKLFKRFR